MVNTMTITPQIIRVHPGAGFCRKLRSNTFLVKLTSESITLRDGEPMKCSGYDTIPLKGIDQVEPARRKAKALADEHAKVYRERGYTVTVVGAVLVP
jgi:hypothetical protein